MSFNPKTLRINCEGAVAWLYLNRPDKANSMDLAMWQELPQALAWLGAQAPVRAVVLAGEGRHFCAGIDISVLAHLGGQVAQAGCASRGAEHVLAFVEHAQAAFNALEALRVPVIAAVHGACVGAGVDMIAACDLRLAAADARFCIKEVDLAVVPDVGTIQRLRHVIGFANVAELSYTAETFDASRAQALGLVSRVCESRDAMWSAAGELARTIAGKSPVTVRGIKRNLLWARDHDVADGLAYTAAWNAGMLIGEDAREAQAAYAAKREPKFRD